MQIDEKTGYLTIPGLREAIRVQDGKIQGETGWSRFATTEEEALYAALVGSAQVTQGEGAGLEPQEGGQP